MRLGYNTGTEVHCCRCDWVTAYTTLEEADLGLRIHLREAHHRYMVSREEQVDFKEGEAPRCVWSGPKWNAFGDRDPYYKGGVG